MKTKLVSITLAVLLFGALFAIGGAVAAQETVVPQENQLTFEDQEPVDGEVTVGDVSTDQDSTVVVTYEDGGENVIAGLNTEANNLNGEDVQVEIEDTGGFPGEHTAWLFDDTDLGDVGIGDDATPIAGDALVSETALVSIDVTGDGNLARDSIGDGLLNDIDGDGTFSIADVQALFMNLDNPVVQDNAAAFNFAGVNDDRVSVFDIQALFTQFQSGPVRNVDQQTAYEEIQPAVDNANEGDTILVEPGTYEEEVEIGVAGLTLESVGDAEETEMMLASISADNVTVDGFTAEGIAVFAENEDENDVEPRVHEHSVSPTQLEPSDSVSGVTVENNIVEGQEAAMLVAAGNGGSVDDVSLADNQVPVAFVGAFGDGSITGVSATGNTFGSLIVINNTATVEDLTVLDNSFEGDVPDEFAEFRVLEESSGDLALDFREVFDENNFDRGVATFDDVGDIRPGDVDGGTSGAITTDISPHFDEDVAQPGDTTEVAPGTYEENIEIDVEDVTLESVEEGAATIEGDIFIGNNASNPVSADGTVIDGFEIVEPGLTGDGQGIGVTESAAVVIQNNAFEGFRTQISLDFAGADVEDITIQGNTFSDVNEADGTAIGATENVDGLDILNNEFINNRNDIGTADSTTNVTIDGNEFTAGDSDSYVSVRAVGLDAQTVLDDNEFDPNGVIVTGDGNQFIVVEGGAFAPVVNVDQRTGFDDIPAALNEVNTDETIQIAEGDYSSFDITTDGVTLSGSGMDSTTISGQNSVDATGVTVRDVELDASGGNSWIVESDAEIDGLSVVNVKTVENSIGIEIRAGENSPDKADGLHIENFQVENNTVKGLYLERANNATLRDITIDGITYTGDENPPSNGIDLNLKYQAYENITIEDTVISGVMRDDFGDNPTWNAGLAIKARDDPDTYDGVPATLDGLTIDNVTIESSTAGLRIGEPGVDYTGDPTGPTGVTIIDSSFVDNDEHHVEDLPDSLDLQDVSDTNNFDPDAVIATSPGSVGTFDDDRLEPAE